MHDAGAQKAQCLLERTEKHELNVLSDRISLFRTTYDTDIHLTALCDQKKGVLSINTYEKQAIAKAVADVVVLARISKPDPAYEIAELQPSQVFHSGPEIPDRDLMYDRLTKFLAYSKATYPKTILEEVIFDFCLTHSLFQNSNGVDFVSRTGQYTFNVMFTSKDGKKTSSSNYTDFSTHHLNQKLQCFGSVDMLLQQSAEQIDMGQIPETFIGDVIITPDCLRDFIKFLSGYLNDYAVITGNSIFKDALNCTITDESLTLHSRPVSDDIINGYFFTHDGYKARNSTIIDQGILKSFLLSLYGSRKTGSARAVNQGGAFVVEAGNCPIEKMISSVKKGIMLCRFSGDAPCENGDFSGIAKNSYYLENGKIQYPLNETMVSGNLKDLLLNICNISRERINFGNAVLPWIQVENITTSGK